MRIHRELTITSYSGYDKYTFGSEQMSSMKEYGLNNMFTTAALDIDSKCNDINIITHGGTFHGDEMSAIALTMIMFPDAQINVFRLTRKMIENFIAGNDQPIDLLQAIKDKFDLSDLSFTFVVDILGYLNQDYYNDNMVFLDHHQDVTIEASNMLMMHYLIDTRYSMYGLEPFMQRISNIDRFKSDYNEHPTEFTATIRSFNSLPTEKYDFAGAYYNTMYKSLFTIPDGVSDFNNMHIAFINALAYSVVSVSRAVVQSITAMITKKDFLALPTMNGFKVSTTPAVLAGWQTIAEEEGLHGLIVKNTQEEGFVVISHDTTKFKLVPGHNEIFIHKSGFLGKYRYFEDAMAAIGVAAIPKE